MKLSVFQNNTKISDFILRDQDIYDGLEIFIGRAEDCHLIIQDPLISRHQILLKKETTGWTCQNLGTFVEVFLGDKMLSSKIDAFLLSQEDVIKFNQYRIHIEDISPSTEILAKSDDDHGSVNDSQPETKVEIESAEEILEKITENHHEDLSAEPSGETDIFSNDEEHKLENELEHESEVSSETEGEDFPFKDNAGEDLTDQNEIFGDDQFDGGHELMAIDSEDDKTRIFQNFVSYELILSGDYAPYDRFKLDQETITIGRDSDECQITLEDPEVSLLHARLKKIGSDLLLEDLDSSNGTILNGERINKSQLKEGDEFLIGDTSFTLRIQSELLNVEQDRLMPVDMNQVIETEEIVEEYTDQHDFNLTDSEESSTEKSLIKRAFKDPALRKKIIYALVVGAVGVLMFYEPEDTPSISQSSETQKEKTDLPNEPKSPQELTLSEELENARKVSYELGAGYFEQGRYDLAQLEFEKVVSIDPQYKNVQSYLEQTKIALKKIEQMDAKKREEEERIRLKKIVDELVVKAREAVNEKKVEVAENYFSQIIEKDPENYDVIQLRLELDSWKKSEEDKLIQEAIAKEKRKKMLDALAPGKTSFLKEQWYLAISQLELFLKLKGMDEDLITEANDMFQKAKKNLDDQINPMIENAKSLKEGQDLRAAYFVYLEILKIHPRQRVALTEIENLRELLDKRSKKLYREGLISESLSLFEDAKRKFEEVREVSPTDSDYYKKANDKLKNYLE